MVVPGGYVNNYYYVWYTGNSTKPDAVVIHDSLRMPNSVTSALYRWQSHKIKYDNQKRKVGNSLTWQNIVPDGFTYTKYSGYNYFLRNNFTLFSGMGNVGPRIFYDSDGNFASIDYQGETVSNPYVTNIIKIDSSYNEESPFYLNDVHNSLAHIFKYEHLIFEIPWGFGTLAFEPYYYCKKIPKTVTTVYTNPLDVKDYKMNYIFTYEKTNEKISKINIVRKAYNPDGSSAGPDGYGYIKLYYFE